MYHLKIIEVKLGEILDVMPGIEDVMITAPICSQIEHKGTKRPLIRRIKLQ